LAFSNCSSVNSAGLAVSEQFQSPAWNTFPPYSEPAPPRMGRRQPAGKRLAEHGQRGHVVWSQREFLFAHYSIIFGTAQSAGIRIPAPHTRETCSGSADIFGERFSRLNLLVRVFQRNIGGMPYRRYLSSALTAPERPASGA